MSLRYVVLLTIAIDLVWCQGDKIWNPDEFAQLVKEGGVFNRNRISEKSKVTDRPTEDLVNNRNVVRVGCFNGYILVRGRCVEIIN